MTSECKSFEEFLESIKGKTINQWAVLEWLLYGTVTDEDDKESDEELDDEEFPDCR